MIKISLTFLKFLLKAFGLFLIIVVTFIAFAVILTLIPTNSDYQEPEEGIEIFLASNGLHVNYILPVKNEIMDWGIYFSPEDFSPGPKPYLAIGRGDKGFYTETPTWDDLKVSNVLKALFWSSPTILHIIYIRGKPIKSESVKSLILTPDQYQSLVNYIKESIVFEENGQASIVSCCSYGVSDRFYHSKGTYHLFRTCNDWVNNGLKRLGIKTAIWAPFDRSILYHFD